MVDFSQNLISPSAPSRAGDWPGGCSARMQQHGGHDGLLLYCAVPAVTPSKQRDALAPTIPIVGANFFGPDRFRISEKIGVEKGSAGPGQEPTLLDLGGHGMARQGQRLLSHRDQTAAENGGMVSGAQEKGRPRRSRLS